MSELRGAQGEPGAPDSHTEPGARASAEPPEGGREPGREAEARRAAGSSPAGGAAPRPGFVELVEAAAAQAARLDEGSGPGELQEAEDSGKSMVPGDDLQNTEDTGNSTATVKVVLEPQGHVMTVAFAIGLSVQELKCHLASELRVPVEVLLLSLDGRVVEEQQSLMELGIRPHSSTCMEMISTDPDAHPLRPLRPPDHDSMPDVITVPVQTNSSTGGGLVQEVVVEIERPRQQKAYLGGYRHLLTGAEFHHAAQQTPPRRTPHRGAPVFSRGTQTAELKAGAQQCPVDASTQMTGIGCYVSCMEDRLLTPGSYSTAEQHHDRRLRAVICLQSFARRWLARQAVDRVRRERIRRLAWLDMQEQRRREEKEEQVRERRRRRMRPERREDFDLLYQALEGWRLEAEQQINSSLGGAERKAALCSLLEEEVQLIAAIGCHRVAADAASREKSIKKLLDQSAAPHQWRAADGRLLQMDTPSTIRAGELRDLYRRVGLSPAVPDQRLQVLMKLKHTVQEHHSQLSTDLMDLIDREVHLMTLGVQERSLEGLRRRIATLFLQYIKTPTFNPGVVRVLQGPRDPSQLQSGVFLCRGCHRYRRSAEFEVCAGGALSTQCHRCAGLDNIARSRKDFSFYKDILRRLRAEEQQIDPQARIPFLLQAEDMCYLTEVVWGARSALQASPDLDILAFVRWERQRDWSPWNCILLSKEETAAHLEVEDVHKAYQQDFILQVQHKHSLARRHFSQIPAVAEYLDRPQAAVPGNPVASKPMTTSTGQQAAAAATPGPAR